MTPEAKWNHVKKAWRFRRGSACVAIGARVEDKFVAPVRNASAESIRSSVLPSALVTLARRSVRPGPSIRRGSIGMPFAGPPLARFGTRVVKQPVTCRSPEGAGLLGCIRGIGQSRARQRVHQVFFESVERNFEI